MASTEPAKLANRLTRPPSFCIRLRAGELIRSIQPRKAAIGFVELFAARGFHGRGLAKQAYSQPAANSSVVVHQSSGLGKEANRTAIARNQTTAPIATNQPL